MPVVEGLSGLFRSAEETKEPENGIIRGELPPWIDGSFILTGPAKWDFNGFTLNNWLDGCCMATKFNLSRSRVTMEKRFLKTEFYTGLLRTGKPLVMTFGTKAFPDERKNFISRIISNYIILEQSDNCSGVSEHGSSLVTCGETCFSYLLNPKTLEFEGEKMDTTKSLGLLNVLGHSNRDPKTGEVYNIGGSVTASGCKMNLIRMRTLSGKISNQGKNKLNLLKNAEIISTWSNRSNTVIPFAHSFGMSQNYVVHIEIPYYMTVLGIMSSTVKGHSFKDILKWHPDESCRFIIVEKKSGKIVNSMEIVSKEPFFVSHFINAYEDNNHLVIDLITAADATVFEVLSMSKLRNKILDRSSPLQATRYVVPILPNNINKSQPEKNLVTLPNTRATAVISPDSNSPTRMILSGEPLSSYKGLENPTMNPNFSNRSYSVFYASHSMQVEFMGRVGKFNVRTGEVKLWPQDNSYTHYFLGAPEFIPNPRGNPEDEQDGAVLCTVTSTLEEQPSFLLVLDAKSFLEIGRVEFQKQIPVHLHSIFMRE